MSNINDFMNLYISTNVEYMHDKNKELELFRVKEENLRDYEDSLNELSKVIKNTKLDSFQNIKDKVESYLLEFDSEEIENNIYKINSVSEFLQEQELELKKLSESFNFIKKTWTAFLKRRQEKDKDSVFINEINEKIEFLYKNFYSADIEEIGRLEQASEDLKQETIKVINLFEELYILLENNVFIGKESNILKKDIEEFLEKDFYESSTVELIKRKEKISFDLNEILKNETKYIKKGIPVVKIQKKDKKEYFFYTLRFDDYVLEFQNERIEKHSSDIIETNQLVYLDNFPENGIFKIKDIKEKLKISRNHFQAMEEFDILTGKLFYIFSSIYIVNIILSIFNLVSIITLMFMLFVLSSIFYFSFTMLLKSSKEKFKVKKAFFFIPTNYYLLKEGDINFNYKDLIFNILINAEKTITKER